MILSRILTKVNMVSILKWATNSRHYLIWSEFQNCWTTPHFSLWLLSRSENQIQSDWSQYYEVQTSEVCSTFWRCWPLKAKSCYKDMAIVLKAANFCIAPLEGIDKIVGGHSASIFLPCGQYERSLSDHPSLTRGSGGNSRTIINRPAQRTWSSPYRDKGEQGLLLDPAQNTEPSHNVHIGPEDVEGPIVSVFTNKQDFNIIMLLMLLCLQCVMVLGSIRACLLFMRDFVFARIGEQGVLEALFSCKLENFLRIFLYEGKEERRERRKRQQQR